MTEILGEVWTDKADTFWIDSKGRKQFYYAIETTGMKYATIANMARSSYTLEEEGERATDD